MTIVDVDWEELRAAAVDAMRSAYAPYSNFPVGVAGLVDDGRIVVGCNVENASYGLGLCAECGLVSALHASGGGRLVAIACVDGKGQPLMPCGRCRQLLWEHGGGQCLVDAPGRTLTMADLLPEAFDVTDLQAAAADTGSMLPARLREWQGRGTVFVHPDARDGQRVWTAYWERSDGFADGTADADVAADVEEAAAAHAESGVRPAGEPAVRGILEEAPTWVDVSDAVAWGRARTPRVVVVDVNGDLRWAGESAAPAEVPELWVG
jgi:cytidine deaminase